MTASEGSYVGLAKQTAKGTPNTTDAQFKYLLFNEGNFGPSPTVLPLDPEVGGGALLRNVQKVGVVSGGALSFVPRPASLGHFIHGILPTVNSVDNTDGSYTHTFTLGADHFDAPYFTVRNAPGNLWGEQYQDCRVSSFALSWRGANYLRAQAGILGGLPTKVSTASWSAATYVDSGPQMITPISDIELPTATDLKVLSGSFAAALAIPLDEQFIVGSYSPDAFDITSKQFVVSFVVKVTDTSLYTKIMYDPAAGSAWVADIYKEADMKLLFNSVDLAAAATPFSLQIDANGDNQASGTANIAWSATPIPMRAQRNLLMNVTGTFLADPGAGDPVTITLINQTASY